MKPLFNSIFLDKKTQQKPSAKKSKKTKSAPKKRTQLQLMETYFGVSDRAAEGFFKLFREKLPTHQIFATRPLKLRPERSEELIDWLMRSEDNKRDRQYIWEAL